MICTPQSHAGGLPSHHVGDPDYSAEGTDRYGFAAVLTSEAQSCGVRLVSLLGHLPTLLPTEPTMVKDPEVSQDSGDAGGPIDSRHATTTSGPRLYIFEGRR